ncbi:MAG TPA: hypothetical protein VFD70_05670 [Anaerolineae bacterium]|nr:hypothetical protein [Anaerolineae bacterium]
MKGLSRLLMFVLIGVIAGFLTPWVTYAAGPAVQTAPIEGSIFPALLQVAMIVLVAEGIKSLSAAFGWKNPDGTPKLSDRAAALAYIIVGIGIYGIQTFLLPALPPNVADALTQFLASAAVIIGGSGLFSMTSALRVPTLLVRADALKPLNRTGYVREKRL